MKKNNKIHFAVLAGCCASAASLFGKLCGLPILQELLIIRIALFGLMLLCNAGVWTLFVKALHNTGSTLTATVISAASNYLLSALNGFLIFQEVTTLFWWSGMFLIMCGLLLIVRDESKNCCSEDKTIKLN